MIVEKRVISNDVNQVVSGLFCLHPDGRVHAGRAFAADNRLAWMKIPAGRRASLPYNHALFRQAATSTMNERKSLGLPDRIYGDILNRILEGEYKEGERLPTEHALAERFEPSGPTVREALARLRADGITVTRHGSGTTVVRRPDPDVRRFAPLETLSDIRRCYEFRIVTEAGAAALAAQQAEADDVAAIQHAWDELERVVETQGIGAKDDFAFHLAVARASKNQFFITVMSFIEEQIVFSMNLSRNLSLVKTLERQRLVQREHLAVLEAIRRKDSAAAGQAMRAHLENARDRM